MNAIGFVLFVCTVYVVPRIVLSLIVRAVLR